MPSSVYELPWGPNKKWLSDGTLGKIIGGWQLSGLFVAQSGQALTIGGNGVLNTPGNTAFVNLNGENKVLGDLGPGLLYFDPTVYSLPAAGVQGNMKRHSGPDGPGFWQLDCVAVQALRPRRRALRRVPRRRLQRDELGPLGQSEHRLQHGDGQHVRQDHRHDRQPAQRSASAPASCSSSRLKNLLSS